MAGEYVECTELNGRTIQALRIYRDAGDGTELQIDFPDGTTFTCCFSVKPGSRGKSDPTRSRSSGVDSGL